MVTSLDAEDRARLLKLRRFYDNAERMDVILSALKAYMAWSSGKLPKMFVSRMEERFVPEEWEMPLLPQAEGEDIRTITMLCSEGLYGDIRSLMECESIEDEKEVVRNALVFLEKVGVQRSEKLYVEEGDGKYARLQLVLE